MRGLQRCIEEWGLATEQKLLTILMRKQWPPAVPPSSGRVVPHL